MISEIIFELRDIGAYKALLKNREAKLARPLLSDTSKLDVIYKIVKDECLNNKSLTNYDAKYYFVAIASFLYTPRSWMGESFKLGLRNRIASILDCTPSYVSNIFRDVTDWYIIYKDFRGNVEYLYDKVVSELIN